MKRSGRKSNISDWITLHGVMLAVCLLLYPSFMDCISYITQTSIIGAYEGIVNELPNEDVDEQLRQAHAYNEKIFKEQQNTDFTYQGEQYVDPLYDAILSVIDNNQDLIMGYLEIEAINLYLPIAHGTKSEYLQYEAGHIYGTSLPVPTGNTRAVIAGHTGLKEALLFTNLTKISKGDNFHIHILGHNYSYQVIDIEVVYPEEADACLQIEPGQDLVTLFTCTPYGVNDHRLLVTGTYVGEEKETSESDEWVAHQENQKYKIFLVGMLCIPVGIMMIGSCRIRRKE